MLEVGWEDDGFVTSFAGELDAEIPRVERDEGELEVVWDQVFLGKLIETGCSVTEGTGITNMLPGEGG